MRARVDRGHVEQLDEVAPVFGQDGSAFGGHRGEQVTIRETGKVYPLRDRDHIMSARPQLDGNLLRVELVEDELQEARSSCSARQMLSARSAALIARSAKSSTST